MDATERARLRALCRGIAMPWEAMEDDDADETRMVVLCPHGDTDDRDTVAVVDMGHDRECDEAHAALIVGAVNALPALLDDSERLDAVTRERDALRAELTRLREPRPSAIVLRPVKDVPETDAPLPWDDEDQALADGDRRALDAVTRERDEACAEVERLREQVRVWRALAREGAIASSDLGVIGATEAALALAACARRASQHAAQGVEAAREHTDRAVDEIRRTLPAALRLATEDEREACAALCDEIEASCRAMQGEHVVAGRLREASEAWEMAGVAEDCADAIRARGTGGAT